MDALKQLQDLIVKNGGIILNILFGFSGAIAILFIIIGAIRYLTAGGNEKYITLARETVMYAVTGLIIVISAWVVINTTTDIFKKAGVTDVPVVPKLK